MLIGRRERCLARSKHNAQTRLWMRRRILRLSWHLLSTRMRTRNTRGGNVGIEHPAQSHSQTSSCSALSSTPLLWETGSCSLQEQGHASRTTGAAIAFHLPLQQPSSPAASSNRCIYLCNQQSIIVPNHDDSPRISSETGISPLDKVFPAPIWIGPMPRRRLAESRDWGHTGLGLRDWGQIL